MAVVPHGKIVRLAEEGIHDVADLASRRAEELSAVTTIPESCLDDWVDRAKLANVVGSQVYEQLHSSCSCWTGSYFLAHCSDPEFREQLQSIGVKNPDEIAGLLNSIP